MKLWVFACGVLVGIGVGLLLPPYEPTPPRQNLGSFAWG